MEARANTLSDQRGIWPIYGESVENINNHKLYFQKLIINKDLKIEDKILIVKVTLILMTTKTLILTTTKIQKFIQFT